MSATRKRTLLLAATAIALLFLPLVAAACPVCFGDPAAPSNRGTTNAIWFLLGTVGFVQLGFGALFFMFWRRAKMLRQHRESFHLINGGLH
jgi:hypothetical protein